MKVNMEVLEDLFINVEFEEIPKFTKLVGVTFNDRQNVITQLKPELKLDLIRDYKNEYDKNAIMVYSEERFVGWIAKYLAAKLAPEMDVGIKWYAIIKDITGNDKQNKGVNIELHCDL